MSACHFSQYLLRTGSEQCEAHCAGWIGRGLQEKYLLEKIQSHQGGINAWGHCNCISAPIDIIKKNSGIIIFRCFFRYLYKVWRQTIVILPHKDFILTLSDGKLHNFVHGILKAVWVLAAGCGEMRLATATTLNQAGGLADDATGILAFLHHVVR